MEYRRRIASALAREYRAPETAKTIRSPDSCWGDIFQTAEREVGIPKLFAALKKASRGEWISHALATVKFTPAQKKALEPLLIAKCNAGTIHELFYDEPSARESIVKAMEKNRKKAAANKIFCCSMCFCDIDSKLQARLEKLAAS